MKKKIIVPCSTANLGPGFDVFGLALKAASDQSSSQKLEVEIEELLSKISSPWNCEIKCQGEGSRSLSLAADENLITKVSLYVLRCHGIYAFKVPTRVIICNGIALSRGLGSSAAAVVAGVLLGNESGRLNLSKERMFDYCLMIERHPDNIAAALFGGFGGTIIRTTSQEETARKEIPLSEVLPENSGSIRTSEPHTQIPPSGIGRYRQFQFNTDIKFVVVIPNFKLNTAEARGRLPGSYVRDDVPFTTQRCALLPILLSEAPPNASDISEAMRDRMHQPYREGLIPGFSRVLRDVRHDLFPGLLSVFLSGAGPSIMALATFNFEIIARAIIAILSEAQDIRYDWQVLELATDGATVEDC